MVTNFWISELCFINSLSKFQVTCNMHFAAWLEYKAIFVFYMQITNSKTSRCIIVNSLGLIKYAYYLKNEMKK